MQLALSVAGCEANDIDWIIASSETHIEYPSLAAQLHKRTKVREKCGVLDAGGGCLGLLNALAVAQSFVDSSRARNVAVVTADVHSRTLVPGRVAGEFGGLFGDGASAFVLRDARGVEKSAGYFLGRFFFGCANQYVDAICVAGVENGGLAVRFDGGIVPGGDYAHGAHADRGREDQRKFLARKWVRSRRTSRIPACDAAGQAMQRSGDSFSGGSSEVRESRFLDLRRCVSSCARVCCKSTGCCA
jgi:hypothetical protein